MYAPARENLEYIRTVVTEKGFYKYMHFRHEILNASWTDEDAMWTLSIKDIQSGTTFDDKVHLFLEFNGPVR
jgi:cation diffusion facilitator CzcD-associated flavoprotein CzcO